MEVGYCRGAAASPEGNHMYAETALHHVTRFEPLLQEDIIGVITAISGVEHIQTAARAAPSLKRTIFICDASNHKIRLDMWGEYTSRFEADNIRSIGKKESLIAIFVETLPKTYKGQTSLSRSSACRWYINENIPEINALHASDELNDTLRVLNRMEFVSKGDFQKFWNEMRMARRQKKSGHWVDAAIGQVIPLLSVCCCRLSK